MLLGEFQNLLVDLPGKRLNETIPDFHHTRKRFTALQRAIQEDHYNRAQEAQAEIKEVVPGRTFNALLSFPQGYELPRGQPVEFTVKAGDGDMTFAVDSKVTTVVAKEKTHKFDQLRADGKPAVITEFLSENQVVSVKYVEKDGKMVAKKVHVKQP